MVNITLEELVNLMELYYGEVVPNWGSESRSSIESLIKKLCEIASRKYLVSKEKILYIEGTYQYKEYLENLNKKRVLL